MIFYFSKHEWVFIRIKSARQIFQKERKKETKKRKLRIANLRTLNRILEIDVDICYKNLWSKYMCPLRVGF